MTELVMRIIAVLVLAYLLGGIPWALVIGRRFYGIDLREHGSGNLGATNVFRVLGARAGAVTLLLDAFKGAAAVLASALLVNASYGVAARDWTAVAAMLVAVLGHSYSPYIRLRGGKGVATSAGALFVLMPLAATISLFIFIAVTATSRMVSLGSLVIALAFPVLVLTLYPDSPSLVSVSFVLAAVVIWRHRANIVRIVRGEESKISLSGRGSATTDSKERGN
jgi:acyl phosphate:glycerol-3-phosphate acyltransferase